jgi:hypothetical protein
MLGVDKREPTSLAADLLTQLVTNSTPSRVDAPKSEVYTDNWPLLESLRRQAAHRIISSRKQHTEHRHQPTQIQREGERGAGVGDRRRQQPERSSPSNTQIDLLPVFKAGDRNESGFSINTFRIPGFVVANGTLVVAAEARTYSFEDMSPHQLVVKRSTDNGTTWGPLQTVVEPGRVWGPAEGGPHGGAVFDPTPVYDAVAGIIHIIFSYQPSKYVNWSTCMRRDNQTGPCTAGSYINCTEIDPSDPSGQQLFSVSSTDLGASWTSPRNLSFAGGKTWCAKTGGGGGNGIQLRNGRLVVPGYHAGCTCRAKANGVTGPSCLNSHVLIADPQDATGAKDPALPAWRLSDEFFPGSAEGSVAELPAAVSKKRHAVGGNQSGLAGELGSRPSRLIFVSRLERLETHCLPSAKHCAGIMYSEDGGETWGEERDDGQLLDPMCKNTVARVGSMLVHSGAANQTIGQRVSITCLFSRDGTGNNWTDPTVVLPLLDANGAAQNGGYSTVHPLSANDVGVVLEAQRLQGSLRPMDILFTKIPVPGVNPPIQRNERSEKINNDGNTVHIESKNTDIVGASTHPSIPVALYDIFDADEVTDAGEVVRCFRIPGIIRTNSGTLIATAEARMVACADVGPHNLVVKRSTDNGKSWGPLQVVVSPGDVFGKGEGGINGGAVMNPVPVYDAELDQVHIIFSYVRASYISYDGCGYPPNSPCQWGNLTQNISSPSHYENYVATSTDNGVTWGENPTTPTLLNLSNLVVPGGAQWCQLTPGGGGHGVQLINGARAGRLLVAGYHGGCQCISKHKYTAINCLHSHLFVSDDHGRSWLLGDEFFPGSAEGSVAELLPPKQESTSL